MNYEQSDAINLANYIARLNWTVGNRGHKDIERLRAEVKARRAANRALKLVVS